MIEHKDGKLCLNPLEIREQFRHLTSFKTKDIVMSLNPLEIREQFRHKGIMKSPVNSSLNPLEIREQFRLYEGSHKTEKVLVLIP